MSGADGGSRTRAPVLPRPWTAVIRHRRACPELVEGVPAGGVAPPFLPCHGSGLLLTYAGKVWSGSGDLHAALPAPQAGGTLSSLEPVEGAAGVAPAQVAYSLQVIRAITALCLSPTICV